ncbi:MAG TPA: ABC transporter permease [Xanthomonadales bacterium]|nr:ABC transporter permease [Xanthomonadales bacterium]
MMGVLMAMVAKDLKLLFRDKVTLFFTFGFPLLFAAFFGSIFSSGSSGSGMAVAVADLDQSANSQQFVRRMDELDELRVEVTTDEQARELTRKGKKTAFIILQPGFGTAYGSLFTGSPPEIVIGVDPSRKAEAGLLQGVMMKLGIGRFEDAFNNADVMAEQLDKSLEALQSDANVPEEWKQLLNDYLPQMKELVEKEATTNNQANDPGEAGPVSNDSGTGMGDALMPLKLVQEDVVVQREGPANAYAITMPQAMFWAIMGVVMGFGVALVQEKAKGTMTRLVVAPITRMQILGGKALGCFLALVLVLTVFFVLARLLFDVPIDHPQKVLFAVLSVATIFVGIMMFLAAIGKTERGMSSVGWAVMMVFAMFGGGMIPLFAMPAWMLSISNFSPVKWAILMFEGATWREFSLAEMLLPCSVMLLLGVVLFVAGSRLLRLER